MSVPNQVEPAGGSHTAHWRGAPLGGRRIHIFHTVSGLHTCSYQSSFGDFHHRREQGRTARKEHLHQVPMLLPILLLLSAAATAASKLELHDVSGQGSIEFEPTGATRIEGDIHGINFSVPITISSANGSNHACTLGYEGGALRASCPIITPDATPDADVCSERMDFMAYSSVWNSRCTGRSYTWKWFDNTSDVFTGCTYIFNSPGDPDWRCPTRNGISLASPIEVSEYPSGTQVSVRCYADAEPDRCATHFDWGCHRYQSNPQSYSMPSSGCNATGCTYTCYGDATRYGWFDEERMCTVLQTKHSTNSLQACGDLCAADKECTAITFVDRVPPGECTVPHSAVPVPGMCVLYHFPMVGNGISSIEIRTAQGMKPQYPTRTVGDETFDLWCVPFFKETFITSQPFYSANSISGSNMASLCAHGPGIDASWPRKCGIVSYIKASANVNSSSSGSNQTAGTFNYTAVPSFIGRGSC